MFCELNENLRCKEIYDAIVGVNFTVFAPTDRAFQKIPPAEMNELMKNKTKLAEIVKYHIVKV